MAPYPNRQGGMPLSIFAMMDSVMTLQRRCVVASPGPELRNLRVGALRMADPGLTGNEFMETQDGSSALSIGCPPSPLPETGAYPAVYASGSGGVNLSPAPAVRPAWIA